MLAVVLVSCSQQQVPAPAEPVARADEQHLRVAVGTDPFLAFGPRAAAVGLRPEGPAPGIFETLTSLSANLGVRPGLAVTWEALSPTQWRFELRRGVRFHDGTPMTAAAVADSLRRLAARGGDGGAPLWRGLPRGLEPDSASAVNDVVVQVVLSEPNLRLAEQLANPFAGVQASGTHAGDGSSPALTPTGTGPFRFSSYRPGVALDVTAHSDYWDGPPQLSRITFRFGPDKDASLLLATGEVDAVGYVSADRLANVTDGPDRRVRSPATRSAMLLLNRGGIGRWSTLQEDAVRQAVARALDRRAVAETAWPDAADPADTLIPSVMLGPAGDQVRPAPRDVAAAADLLSEAGWLPGPDGLRSRQGRRLSLDVLVRRPSDGLPTAAEAVRGQLEDIGIATSVTDVLAGNPTPLQRVNAGTFDLFLDLRPQEDANPCALCRLFSLRPGGDLTVSGVLRAGAATDALFDQVHEARTPESARRLAADLVQVVATDEAVALPLATLANVWLVSPRVHQFAPAAVAGAQDWKSVFLSR